MKWLSAVLVLVGCVWVSGAQAAISVTDNTGQTVTLTQPAQRIISLAPSVTEVLFAVGAGAQLVGAVDYSDYPSEAKLVPRVGAHNALDPEALLALKPDLIVGWASGNSRQLLETLLRLGVPLYLTESKQLNQIASNLEDLGQLSGHVEQGRAEAKKFRDSLAALKAQYASRAPVSVYYQIWDRPLMTINGEQVISEVIRLCGGTNVFADLEGLAPQVDIEGVLLRNPEAIIASSSKAQAQRWRQNWQQWSMLSAVKMNNIFAVEPDLLHRSGPRVSLGAAQLCEYLQTARERRLESP